MRARWVLPVLAAVMVLSGARVASAQYGGHGGTIFPGVPVSGTFQPTFPIDPRTRRAYVDYILNVTVPGSYTIDLRSSSSSAYDPYLYLLQGGREIDRNDDGGGYPHSRITRFLAPGTYIVRASSFRSGPVGPAHFTLQVSGGGGAVGVPVHGAMVVHPGVPVRGTFQPTFPVDPRSRRPYIDYMLTVAVPGTYQIDLMSPSSSAYDPYLYLLQGGVQIATNDDGGGYPNSRITRYLAPGVYQVRVSSFRSGPIGPVGFTLQVMRR